MGKGCDIGYALAACSCEGTHGVDARTVTALDVNTAFAVPNPNFSSQSCRFFRVWMFNGLPRQTNHPAYFGLTKFLFESTLSAVDGSQGNICAGNVNALFRCKLRRANSIRNREQTTELLKACKSERRIVLIFHTIFHIFLL
jgi:hypothetical protein